MRSTYKKGDRVWVEPGQIRGADEGFFGVVIDARNPRTNCVHILPDEPRLRDLALSPALRDGEGEWFQLGDPRLTVVPLNEAELLFA